MEFNGYEYHEDIGQYQELKLSSVYQGEQYGISTVAFDLQEDLLWAGTYGGHVTSFYGPSLEKYTAFQAHHSDIRQLQSTPSGIVSVSSDELRLTSRTGHPRFTMQDENALMDMNTTLCLDESSLLVGCQGNKITTVNLSRAKITREVTTGAGVCLLKSSEYYVCSGDVTGKVHLLDPHTLRPAHSYSAHSAGMCDMDVVGPYLVTCGLTQRFGQLLIDCRLKVFDLRANRPLPPCDVVMLQPFLIKAVPALNSTVLVLSQMGEFQLLDLRGLVTPSTMVVHQLSMDTEGAMACAVDVGPSCHCVALGDSCGAVHVWADHEEVVFNPYTTQPTVLPSETTEELPYISWDDNDPDSAPLSVIPTPLAAQNGQLLSNWPPKNSRFKRRQAPPIDPEVLKNMKMQQFIGHAPKPSHILRNQVPYDLEKDRSESVPESPMMRENNPLTLVPKPYRQVEIKYSKLGIEMFDFKHYNRTNFAGLEIHIPNAYCNSMLQVLYFLDPVRAAMQSHLCAKEFCLSCELGFLFRMLDRSDGRSCQASNFLRAFRTLREASGLGLLLNWGDEQLSKKVDLSKLIQSWTRFVLQQVSQETHSQQLGASGSFSAIATTLTSPTFQTGQPSFLFKEAPKDVSGDPTQVSVIERLFGSEMETRIECGCGWRSAIKRTELLHSLLYPHKAKSVHSTVSVSSEGSVSFGKILQQSICREQRLPAWCGQCAKYKSTTQAKQLCGLPYVLALTCRVETDKDREFWQRQQAPVSGEIRQRRWVPLEMTLNLTEDGSLCVREGPPEEVPSSPPPSIDGSSADYQLLMAVSHVKEPWMESSGNLVAHINVGDNYHSRKEGVNKQQWYLFNDFHITPLQESEVGVFPTEWLTPCVLIYAQRGYSDEFNTEVSCQLEPSVLLAETHQPRPVQSPVTFTPLSLAEIPEEGDVVGVDAEFVTLNQEEAEVKSDGTHTTLKPSQLSVARITVTRGKGTAGGSPFIDDYIATSEQVVDYVTRFSGIKPEDLDAVMSSKHLTTLKASYLKLLFLINRGVIFVGHGLKKDFRVINIMVPPEQVIDTVELFHLPNQRYISLKLLAWFYAGLRVQESAHDSAEDARTAVVLYHKFKELEAAGTLQESLKELYKTGRSCGWVVPDR
ncbi:PAN2-PAN3 deadenylation complex catalytic subunit PAN2-like isoform X2 [Halichondria panicea]|uniref:PAN2-PAN3 deadenylation complex catalytic subunit PAN2-like isoform X2 n=1 Tax=Halichondria panicea TaxID=6063 RepID=UPI00312B3FD3